MLIYKIPNMVQSVFDYVCDSQETIDLAPELAKATCTIGGESEANTVLLNNQQQWLTEQAELFTVNLQTAVEGGIKWTVVNLSTEPENVDREYFVLDPTTGTYTEATGLDSAKALLVQTQQIYLVFTNMDKYTTMTSWS